jgi:tetratricopeptide (TPR) repeat protein
MLSTTALKGYGEAHMPGDLGKRFRELRTQAGLSGAALATPRYTVSYVSQIEAGRRRPSPEALSFFADRLGVTPSYLATGVPEHLEPELEYRLEEARRALRDGEATDAESAARAALARAEEFGFDRLAGLARVALGDALARQGRGREAIASFEAALEGPLTDREAATTVADLSAAYRSAGDLQYAVEVIESFLNRGDRGPLDPSVIAHLQALLVSIYHERGDMVRAELAAERALKATEEDIDPHVRSVAFWNASRILAETKRWEEALELATRARIIAEESDDRHRVAQLHNVYAFLCLEADPPRREEAAHHLDVAERLLTLAGAPGDLAYVYTERSRLALMEDRALDALSHAERALVHATSEHAERARALFLEGRALGVLGRGAEARESLLEAQVVFEKLGSRQQEANCWREIGELDVEAGDLESAVEAFRSGLRALDPTRSRA